MSNSPGFRGGAIGSAVPKSFSSSPNSGAPFQRTCQTACVDSFLPSRSIDFGLCRIVANELGHDNSDRSNQRQTNKWLARRAEQLHLTRSFRLSRVGSASCNRKRQSSRF